MPLIQPGAYSADLLARQTIPVAVEKERQDGEKELRSQLLDTLPPPPPSRPGQGVRVDVGA